MPEASIENPGCANYCKAGQTVAEEGHDSLSEDAKQFVTDNPCEHVKHGNCRLVEFLIQRAAGSYTNEQEGR
jgi:hypothetical protein